MKVILVEYNPHWVQLFEETAQQIAQIGGEKIAAIEHIGSTSVEGLRAKPIVDMMIGLHDFERDADDFAQQMVDAAYEYVSKYNAIIPQRRFFHKNDGERRLHNIHTVQIGGAWWKRHILFRDYLRTFPEKRAAYEAMKLELAQRDWESLNDYAGEKTAFIRAMEAEAEVYFG